MSRAKNLGIFLNRINKISVNKMETDTLGKISDVDLSGGVSDYDALKYNQNTLNWQPYPYSDVIGNYSTLEYLNQKKDELINNSPEELDTLEEFYNSYVKDESGLSDLLAYSNRTKTVSFKADGQTKKFNVSHISGNVDVWLNGILQTPNITDSLDVLGENTTSYTGSGTYKIQFPYDYYSTDNSSNFMNAGHNLNIGSGSFTFVELFRRSVDDEYAIDDFGFDYHPYPNGSTISEAPIYEITNSGGSESNPAYYYFNNGGTLDRRIPRFYFGPTISINLNTPITFENVYVREIYSNILTEAKQISSHIHFTFTPEYGDIIKVRVY